MKADTAAAWDQFKRTVGAILKVPKADVDAIEAARPKRRRRKPKPA